MSTEIEDESTLRALPLLYIVSTGGARGERVFRWMDCKGTNRFLVMREGHHRLSGREIPQPEFGRISYRAFGIDAEGGPHRIVESILPVIT